MATTQELENRVQNLEIKSAVLEDRLDRADRDISTLRDDIKTQITEIKDTMNDFSKTTTSEIKSIGDNLNKKLIWALSCVSGGMFTILLYMIFYAHKGA